MGAERREAARGKPLSLALHVQRLEELERPLHSLPGRCREQVILGKGEQPRRPPITATEQPGDTRGQMGDQERAPQTGCAAVDHAAIRSQLSRR